MARYKQLLRVERRSSRRLGRLQLDHPPVEDIISCPTGGGALACAGAIPGPAGRGIKAGAKGIDEAADLARGGQRATKVGDNAPVDVGHAGIHRFSGITPGKSQFFDAADLGQLARTDGLAGVVQKNGNTRYVLRGAGEVGVDRTTGLPTDVYTVIPKPDGSILTMFPGRSPKS